MKAEDHPNFPEELDHLRVTLTAIEEDMAATLRSGEAQPVYLSGQLALAELQERHLGELQQARSVPYHGRVDFRRHDGTDGLTPLYIGKVGIRRGREHLVYHWRAPIADLFYRAQFADASYETKDGRNVRGDVSLRRQFRIRSGLLEEISDERPAALEAATIPTDATAGAAGGPAGGDDGALVVDEVLRGVLAEHRDPHLRDIVATIRAEQFALIEAPPDGALIVQGVAGSGKTSVALHRLAYFLYRHHERVAVRRTIVFGPNPLFLRSIAGILPGLGEHDVRQTTFAAWAQEQLGGQVECHEIADDLDGISDPTVARLARLAAEHRSRLKGSMRMARLVDAYLRVLERRRRESVAPLGLDYRLPSDEGDRRFRYKHAGRVVAVELDADAVREALDHAVAAQRARDIPLNQVRRALIDRLLYLVWRRFVEHSDAAMPAELEWPERAQVESFRLAAFQRAIKRIVSDQVAGWWPTLSAAAWYRTLLATPADLDAAIAELGGEPDAQSVTPYERDLLLVPHGRAHRPSWAADDLPALCYLDLRLNGQRLPSSAYDHVVVDEAQDISPLQLWLLRRHTAGGSMTLVGDLAQGVYEHAIGSWREFDEVLEGAPVRRADLTVSYRATEEITRFANGLLGRLRALGDGGAPAIAQPVARPGASPGLQRCASLDEVARRVLATIDEARRSGARSIVVLCKTAAACRALAAEMDAERHGVAPVLTRDAPLSGDAAIMPIHLTKGLEFERVILADADAATYHGDSPHDAKLLYVAVTRALHDLRILWTGKPTPLLPRPLGAEDSPLRADDTARSASSVAG